MSQLILRPEAEQDLARAFFWYESRREGLGFDLMLQADAAFHQIQRSPQAFPVVHRGVRKHLLRRFPYKVLYQVTGEKIIIVAVLACRLDVDNPR